MFSINVDISPSIFRFRLNGRFAIECVSLYFLIMKYTELKAIDSGNFFNIAFGLYPALCNLIKYSRVSFEILPIIKT